MNVRSVLASVLASTSLGACCLDDGDWHSKRYAMPATAEGRLGELVADCRTNDVCEPLCLYHWVNVVADVEADSEVRNCVREGDTVSYEGHTTCAAGRRPAGFAVRARAGVGGYFAMQAALEAASVRAFADLFADLAVHGAPAELRRAAIDAAADEIRHAELCGHLARRYGVRAAVPAIAAAPPRTLRELAIDNVVEGCVREMFGAAVAAYQASAARDPLVRVALRAIAVDEARHAQLAWDIHAWLAPADMREHARAAAEALVADVDPRIAAIAGLPDRATQATIAHAIAAHWS